jgi:hypothetical protein
MQRVPFFCALFIGLAAPSSRASTFPEEGWTTVSKESKDLNGDGKADSIYWLTRGQGQKPERLLVVVDDRPVLDFKTDFCEPDNGYRNPDGCYHLSLTTRLSAKKQPLLVLRSEETSSSVDQASSTYIYRWQKGDFALIGATYESHETPQVEERQNDQVDINYSTGKAIQSSWVEVGSTDKLKDKKSQNCTLKNPRKTELLKDFSSFNISDEVICK